MEGHKGKWPSRSDGREEEGDVGRRPYRVSLRRNEQSKVNKRYELMIYSFLLCCLICWHTNVLVVSMVLCISLVRVVTSLLSFLILLV